MQLQLSFDSADAGVPYFSFILSSYVFGHSRQRGNLNESNQVPIFGEKRFTVDKAGYANIVKQVRYPEFEHNFVKGQK